MRRPSFSVCGACPADGGWGGLGAHAWAGRERDTAERKVKEAHRRIMVANHPDGGGSDFLASKINEAKDLLLKAGGKNSTSTF